MVKIKIKEIKSNIKIKEIKKQDSSLEKEVESEEFPRHEILSSSSRSNVLLEESEEISSGPIIRQLPPQVDASKTDDLPQFSESARYNTTNSGNVIENRSGYSTRIQRNDFAEENTTRNNFVNTAERINPSIRSSEVFQQDQSVRRTDLMSGEPLQDFRINRDYDQQLDKIKSKAKGREPWEI